MNEVKMEGNVVPYEHPCFIFHRWSKWEDVEQVKIGKAYSYATLGGAVLGEILIQKKVCLKCNKKKFRQEKIWKAGE